MQGGSAKGSIKSIIEQVLAIRLSAGVESQDSRREARRLGVKDCFQGGSIILARKRQYNGASRDLGGGAVGRPLKSVHKAARDTLQPVGKDSLRQTALIVVLNPEPKRRGPVIRGFTISRLKCDGNRVQALRPDTISRRRA